MLRSALSSPRMLVSLAILILFGPSLARADETPVIRANFKQAHRYSADFLKQYVYSTSVVPGWIGKTDSFWYEYRTSAGKRFYRVSPKDNSKEPLFAHERLAGQLSEMTKKPVDSAQLPLERMSINDEGTKIKFVTGDFQYEYEMKENKLVRLGKAPAGPPPFKGPPELKGKGRGKGFGKKGGKFGKGDYRVFSPDKKSYVFAKDHNLYLAEADNESEAVQLTKDGVEDYGFGAKKGKSRPQADWSKDSKAFYVTRSDARGVQELFLVNSLALPRPTLTKYKYAMPGDPNIRKSELLVFHKDNNKLVRIKPKWKDESYSNFQWSKKADELHFIRHDRLQRNLELCTLNALTGEARCLIAEGFANSNVAWQAVKYLDDSGEMIWWSEKDGWGHFYLYDRQGKLKNRITAGAYRASAIVEVDPKSRMLFFRGNAREPGENVYYQHLYCVRLDGMGLTLMDPGDAFHASYLSPSRRYVVDNCTRMDKAPISVLRDATGHSIMTLEKADLSRLLTVGWKFPETFTVKAADGVTDLFGNMWKPFDFDARKRYPIIAYVYPGPQQEGVVHTFTPSAPQQQLAQLGFIVIQVGNRGGTPGRSKAYQAFGYGNLRDYGLADKKTAIEQLAARHAFINLDKVGIYGHSGGGFMSAAAMLQKPYNEFFKAAVASAGNHDNNIYNHAWAERYHGMREVPVTKDDAQKKADEKSTDKTKGKKKRNPDEDSQDKGKDKDAEYFSEKAKAETRFEIKVPTNAELAGNLKGRLLLVHGDLDNNVHPANTLRLADALIKANKRFDMLILPGKAHGFADYQPYFTQRLWEFFAEHLLGDRPSGVDMGDRGGKAR